MKYKAVAAGVMRDGHPVHFHSSDLATVKLWAKEIARQENCQVIIYKLTQSEIARMDPDGKITIRLKYRLGVSSPAGFELVSYTYDLAKAQDWVLQASTKPGTINVYGTCDTDV